MGKGHSPEQIIRKLRQAEVKIAAGATLPEVAREPGRSMGRKINTKEDAPEKRHEPET